MSRSVCVLGFCCLLAATASAQEPEPTTAAPDGAAGTPVLRWSIEGKANFRRSDAQSFPSPFPFPSAFLPPGATQGFESTVDPGSHFEISDVALVLDAVWSPHLLAHAKADLFDLYYRNPTSSDKKWDLHELWLRLGRDPEVVSPRCGGYLKIGRFPHFERQNDRHLESYGLATTAFDRTEDQGAEAGVDLGRHVYLRLALTQGNPLFFRDPNALAGDNGTPAGDPSRHANPTPKLATGFPILYDAEVEALDVSGHLARAAAIGLRFGDRRETGRSVDLLGWYRKRTLADRAAIQGSFYGGDLDLLRGPFDSASLPISGREKREAGAELRLYAGGLSLFGQYVDQRLAGMKRTGWEAELAWRVELPLVWAVDGRQLFRMVQPALRVSRLEPEFAGGSKQYPAPSVRWYWTKIDYGVRVGVLPRIDVTAEYEDNQMILANGKHLPNNEFLATLRFRMASGGR